MYKLVYVLRYQSGEEKCIVHGVAGASFDGKTITYTYDSYPIEKITFKPVGRVASFKLTEEEDGDD